MQTDAPAAPDARRLPLPSRGVCLDLLRDMILIRRFEEAAAAQYAQGRIGGFLHSAVGEEAAIVGAARALREGDRVVSQHREHGQALACGCEPGRVMAELFGRIDGLSGGRGGSMHMFDPERGLYGGFGTVAANLPIAVGLALAADVLGTDEVVLCAFADAAADQGAFGESLNLAALWRLPVVFMAIADGSGGGRSPDVTLSRRAEGFGVPGRPCDGTDVLDTHEAVAEALRAAREERRPQLVEAVAPRGRAEAPAADTREAIAEWRRRDPIAAFADRCVAEAVLSDDDVGAIDAAAQERVAEAVAFAAAGAAPAADTLHDHVYAAAPRGRDAVPTAAAEPDPAPAPVRELRYREALGEALREEMRRDERVVVLGEEVGALGGAFKVTEGLLAEFGERRVRDTPVSENAIVGAGVGAAIGGLRPVVELMTVNASLLALDQIVNSAAKVRAMSGGRVSAPLVLRMPQGAGHGLGPTQSHSLEALYAHVPGLQVAAPSTPADARALLQAAIRSEDPVVVLEHEALYAQRGELPAQAEPAPLGAAAIRRPGADVTLIGIARMALVAAEAAETLAREHGIEAEVIDPRALRPLDLDTIVRSVRRTNRAAVVEEGWPHGGLGATLSALISEHAFDELDAPVARVTGADAPVPYARALEQAAVPDADRVVAAVRATFRDG